MASGPLHRAAVPEHVSSLVSVLRLLRTGQASTRPELVRLSGLGRALVNQRVNEAIDYGIVREGDFGPSTGGRAPRQIHFLADAGIVLCAELGATGMTAGVSDLAGRIRDVREEPCDISDGPDALLKRLEQIFDELIRARRKTAKGKTSPPVWGIGIGVPGPVEYATGRPISPPIMPGWDQYPIRGRLAERYGAPVFVDNDVNLMALGELANGGGPQAENFLFVKIGTGIGAGLVSAGKLHRGAQGCAGDIGHVMVENEESQLCRCGKSNCLEALAGGFALARDGLAAAKSGSSPLLESVLAATGDVSAADVAAAAHRGDAASVALMTRSAQLVGATLARIVNFFNPSMIVLGGGVTESGDQYAATIRHVIYERSLPLATRDLVFTRSATADRIGLSGAAAMVMDELFEETRIEAWIEDGSPVGKPEIADL